MSSESKKQNDSSASFKLFLLGLMVAQNSAVVLLGRYTRASVEKDELYVVNHLILVCEFLKCILSLGLEAFTGQISVFKSINIHIISNPLDTLKILIPALLYLVQNSLLYIALSNLSAPLFQVTYQTKLLTTAVVSVVLLARKYSIQQWICLFVLGLGVATVVLAERKGDESDETTDADTSKQNLPLGLGAVSIACLCSAVAGVYFEKVIKANNATKPSVWMRNVQLAFFSVVIAVVQNLTSKETKPFLFGFNAWVWVVVALQAGGGLLVAAVIKYADNVLKGLATGVSVVVSTAFSVILFGTDLSMNFYFGSVMILGSVYIFSNPVSCEKKEELKPEEIETMVLPK